MWFVIYLLSVLVYLIGSAMALYHCVRYGTKGDNARVGATLFVVVSAALLTFSVVLVISIAFT